MNTRKCFAWFLVLMLTMCSYSAAQKTDIGAIGRITPKNGVIQVTCPAGDLIESFAVRVGETVAKGAPLFSLKVDNSARLNLETARSAVREATEIGPLTVELQRLKTKAAEQDYEYALRRLERFKEMGGDSLSAQQMEEREYQVNTAALNLEMAKKDTDRIVREQQSRKERAERDRKAAELALERFSVKAPVAGTVLEILKSAGDRSDGAPVLQLADLSQIVVVAEVFEGDVKRISPGMKASVTNNALAGKLTGKVLSISPVIQRETKIAHVKILLDNPKAASRFINMETNIVIYSK